MKYAEKFWSLFELWLEANQPNTGPNYACGWKVPENKQCIIDLIKSISGEEIKEKRDNALKCKHNFRWQKEEEKLLKIYHSFNNCETYKSLFTKR